jgi:ABC-2 type transport system ATP-binding protein
MAEYSVDIVNITKRFGNLEAVKGVNLKIKHGEIFGILGPNGAGKTTTLNMVLGLLVPSSGHITVEGYDSVKHPEKVKQMIGFMTQETVVESYLTARDNLRIFARLYHVPTAEIEESVNRALAEADLVDFADKPAGTFSGGMQRRLNLVKSMIQEPRVLILDEPTTGLDIQSRVNMWSEIRRLNKKGITIILTTQYLEEADALCDRIAIIDHGKVSAIGTAAELKKIVAKGRVLSVSAAHDDVPALRKLLGTVLGSESAEKDGRIEVQISDRPLYQLRKAAEAIEKAGIDVHEISIRLPTLDDVFIKLTGASFRDTTVEQQSSLTRLRAGV